jgi:hypothetical protein
MKKQLVIETWNLYNGIIIKMDYVKTVIKEKGLNIFSCKTQKYVLNMTLGQKNKPQNFV